MRKFSFVFILGLILLWGCTDDNPSGPDADDFDREEILVNWADNIILPAFESFSTTTGELKTAGENFTTNPNQQTLQELRDAWKTSYLAWQHVSMFEMGKAMDVRFRDYLNTYPVSANESSPNADQTIQKNIQTGTYNLELPSLRDTQGFPALDYLLNGLGDSDDAILEYYTTHQDAVEYKKYINDLVTRMDQLTVEVLDHWESGYRDQFVSNSGNGANGSLDMMVNDYIFYYEKYLRAGKIGIPAGVSAISSGTPSPVRVEAYYSEGLSKALFMEALNATQNFFNGKHYGTQEMGESLASYLDYLNTMKEGADLTQLINNQFESARNQAENLNSDFVTQIETDNSEMLATYDELQKNVVFLKVDMLQALNINVDYVDADGD
ncbi:imelysin family protein [Rhodohalobacter sulfatireducens]|uniref:Imelysin family protein n=1 Tax=Rhodohalobacter sulfatireducens TaxID=2911366 RepID=A0ABS9K9K9_9BACT|nr:imelysin family protein [Rhodohalobacter sulfatireducens]MCG2587521.1 imelysin family protein [Rhodohalobacter sulfatireducens]